MKRSDLYAIVKRVEPALATKDLIPIFSCLCFSKKGVLAYDDLVAIFAPMEKTPLRGAVRGKVLIDWLGSSKSGDVEFLASEDKQSILFKSGRAKLDLPLQPEDQFLFEFPEDKPSVVIPLTVDIIKHLSLASISIGLDPAFPWRYGITLSIKEGTARLYSSDDRTVTRVIFKIKADKDVKLILPPPFCTQLSMIGKSDPPKELRLTKDWIEVEFASGLRLFSRSGSAVDIKIYLQMFENLDEQKLGKKAFVQIPKSLDRSLVRAQTVIPWAKEHPYSFLTIKEGRMYLRTISEAGNVDDAVKFPDADPIKVLIRPELLARVLPFADNMVVRERFLAFTRQKFTHMISTVSKNQPAEETTTEDSNER